MNITILREADLPDPEARAMLGGFYSRSTQPIKERLDELKDKTFEDIKKSLKKYAIGYGHKSLLDMSNTPMIFVEGISILATKAMEAGLLGNYQETSSRYIDFSNQAIVDPLDTEESNYILKNWMTFYADAQTEIIPILKILYPFNSETTLSVYNKAIKARAFDITRCLLPTGITTNVAMSFTLSAFKEHIAWLLFHPLKEVRDISKEIYEAIQKECMYSFEDISTFLDKKKDNALYAFDEFYSTSNESDLSIDCSNVLANLKQSNFQRRTVVPSFLARLGSIHLKFSLDYGSWRDLQRHRNVLYNKCSILKDEGFAFNYFNEVSMNTPFIEATKTFVTKQYEFIKKLKGGVELQYYYPMGHIVNAELVCSLPELIYIIELRSSKHVHTTLRQLIFKIIEKLPLEIKNLLVVKDYEEGFYSERGTHDITKVE